MYALRCWRRFGRGKADDGDKEVRETDFCRRYMAARAALARRSDNDLMMLEVAAGDAGTMRKIFTSRE